MICFEKQMYEMNHKINDFNEKNLLQKVNKIKDLSKNKLIECFDALITPFSNITSEIFT